MMNSTNQNTLYSRSSQSRYLMGFRVIRATLQAEKVTWIGTARISRTSSTTPRHSFWVAWTHCQVIGKLLDLSLMMYLFIYLVLLLRKLTRKKHRKRLFDREFESQNELVSLKLKRVTTKKTSITPFTTKSTFHKGGNVDLKSAHKSSRTISDMLNSYLDESNYEDQEKSHDRSSASIQQLLRSENQEVTTEAAKM